MRRAKVLIIDDERLIRWSLNERLTREGFEVSMAESGPEGLKLFDEERPEAVFLDIRLPGMDGLQVLEKMKEIDASSAVIMITAYGNVDTAVRAMKLGAYDYVNKPFNLDEVIITLNKALENLELKEEVHRIRDNLKGQFTFENMVGKSQKMQEIFDVVRRVAQSETTTVMVQGESGTGKDMIARAIHYQSARADRPFLEIDCTSLPETLVESELFGHERGAFTDAKTLKRGLFELADGGTVLLDEMGDMPLPAQAKLLRIIEEKIFKRVGGVKDIRVDVRVICTTNKDLAAAVRDGQFRQDLYYRLKIIPVYLPPLRERREDIPLLADHFLQRFNREFKKRVKGFSREALEALSDYSWPGNVRELRNVIERAILLGNEDIIRLEHLPIELQPGQPSEATPVESASSLIAYDFPPQGISLKGVEEQLIRRALEITGGNQTRAARLLGISRDTLKYRLKKIRPHLLK